MQILLDNASCVLVGALNRAILRPEWLVQQGLLPEGQQIETEILVTPGPFIQRFSAEGLTWRTEPGKLAVERVDQTTVADPGDKVARLLAVLEHTPVVAVGNNFHFTLDEEAGQRLRALQKSPLSDRLAGLYEEGCVASIMYEGPCEEARLQITFESDGTRNTVRLNFHRDTARTALARDAARRWSTDLAAAESFATHLREMLA